MVKGFFPLAKFNNMPVLGMKISDGGQIKLPISDAGKNTRPIISFTDDDCRLATYEKLFPVLKNNGIVSTLAVPPAAIGRDGYLSLTQLKEMVDYGCPISSHSWNENGVTEFSSSTALEENINKCKNQFSEWGFQCDEYAYPNGLIRYDYIPTIKNYFSCGYVVDRGINQPPVEQFLLRRNEIFPTNGSFDVEKAKALVDQLAEDGGWLVFMTHAWYSTFSADDLASLIDYIKGQNIEIVSTTEAIKRFGNIMEVGVCNKPETDATNSYFAVGADGSVIATNMRMISNHSSVSLEMETAKLIGTNGTVINANTGDARYMVSKAVPISGHSKIYVCGWASDKNGIVRFETESGAKVRVLFSTGTYAEGGTLYHWQEVDVPTGATHVRIAGYNASALSGHPVSAPAMRFEAEVLDVNEHIQAILQKNNELQAQLVSLQQKSDELEGKMVSIQQTIQQTIAALAERVSALEQSGGGSGGGAGGGGSDSGGGTGGGNDSGGDAGGGSTSEEVTLELMEGKVIGSTGQVLSTADQKYVVSQPVSVRGHSSIQIRAWSYSDSGWCVYRWNDSNGYKLSYVPATKTYAEGGNLYDWQTITVPSGAVSIQLAGVLYESLSGFRTVAPGLRLL